MKLLLILSLSLCSWGVFATNEAVEPDRTNDAKGCSPTNNIELNIPNEAFLIKTPPPEIVVQPKLTFENSSDLGFREVVLFLAFIIALGNFIYTIWNNSQEKRKASHQKANDEVDKFWFKEIIIPKVIEPCLGSLESYHKKSGCCELVDLINLVGSDLTELQISFNTVNSMPIVESPNEMKDILTSIFEDLEDNLNHLMSKTENIDEYEANENLSKKDVPSSEYAAISKAQDDFIKFISIYREKAFAYSTSKIS
ncbi:hypothetical protein PMAN_a2227 [Pseudoalteromonas marina]|uniref:hypothetical protein n=1 Tax=Pseudoalteromonas marina TaxID=267375 RepID=UPI00026D0F22|nr:hypothetical protein [Pseudoalteromonas marina]KAF7777022.1 hypothetical protein PMAN_a2227 [Pseudoalteromonas marina]